MYLYAALILSLAQSIKTVDYRKDGQFVFGAILPLTKATGSGQCTVPNPSGIAAAEAYIMAIDRIQSDSAFQSLISTYTLGYDIRDSCDSENSERKIAYDMSLEALIYAGDSSAKKPVDVVLSAFTKSSLRVLHVLNGEMIPQISYAHDNARLMKDNTFQDIYIKMLASAYPQNVRKMEAILNMMQEFKFQYVHIVASNNYQGQAGLNYLSAELTNGGVTTPNGIVISSKADVMKAVDEFKSNPLITVVIVNCEKDLELELYKEVQRHNLSHLIFFSTQNWYTDLAAIKPYASSLEGMVFVQNNDGIQTKFTDYFRLLTKIPYTNKDWVKPLFFANGGTQSCISGVSSSQCTKAEEDTQNALAAFGEESMHAFVASYAIANALKSKSQNQGLLDAMKGISFIIPYLPSENVKVTDELTVASSNEFKIFNLYGNSPNTSKSMWIGIWDKNTHPSSPLRITKNDLLWKNGSQEVPVSTCAKSCVMGYKKKYVGLPTGCWDCERCPNGTVSNTTNADECFSCPAGLTANPEQSKCVEYELKTFEWFGPMGSFIIFLIVIGVCAVLFSLGIISQNSAHEVVLLSGYKTLCLYIFGCLLLFIAPIPLLVSPTVSTCSCYIAFFNLGLTLCFAVLIARSALANSFFDENGAVVKGGCGRFPRGGFIVVVVGIQVLIMLIGLIVDEPQTMHNETDEWNIRYFECSSWASYIFWVGFGYNIALSIVGNCLSCTSTKMQENCQELKYLVITYCVFYLVGLFEVVIFYRHVDEALAEGQAIMCIIFGFCFILTFLWPKIYIILFRSKSDGKTIQKPTLVSTEDGDAHVTTAVHASDGFRHHGIVQMRIKESLDE